MDRSSCTVFGPIRSTTNNDWPPSMQLVTFPLTQQRNSFTKSLQPPVLLGASGQPATCLNALWFLQDCLWPRDWQIQGLWVLWIQFCRDRSESGARSRWQHSSVPGESIGWNGWNLRNAGTNFQIWNPEELNISQTWMDKIWETYFAKREEWRSESTLASAIWWWKGGATFNTLKFSIPSRCWTI